MFPVPPECYYLTQQSKDDVLQRTKCNEQGSKVTAVLYVFMDFYMIIDFVVKQQN